MSVLLQSAGNTKTLCICPPKKLSFGHYGIFERINGRTGIYPSSRSLRRQPAKALVPTPLLADRKFLPLFTIILSVKIVSGRKFLPLFTIILSVKIVFSYTPTHPPTHPDPTPPPGGGVGTLGQIAPNKTNPPTHRPQTPPPEPPPPPWGGTTLKQRSAPASVCQTALAFGFPLS